MQANANTEVSDVASDQQKPAVSVSDTFWGYIIRQGGNAARNAGWGEAAAILGSIAFGILAYCQWLLPGTINSVEVLPFKMAGTVVFFIGAGFLYMMARKGLMTEVQIDTARGAVRMARRNREGESTLLESYPFSDISRVFMKRSTAALGSNSIFIQPASRNRAILAASGPRDQLEPLLARLIEDLKPHSQEAVSSTGEKAKKKSGRGAFAAR